MIAGGLIIAEQAALETLIERVGVLTGEDAAPADEDNDGGES